MKTNFSTRLKQALEIRNMKQITLSEKSGVSRSLISAYLKGDYEAKQDKLYALSKALNVNEAWLMGLDVPMEKEHGNVPNVDSTMKFLDTDNEDYKYIFEQLSELSDSDLSVVKDMVQSLLKNRKKAD